MVDNKFEVQSYNGPYAVYFEDNIFPLIAEDAASGAHFVIDKKVAKLYAKKLEPILANASVLYLDATEENKSLDRFPSYISHLVGNRIKRHHKLVAIGGGIIQDITCFISAILLRGIDWIFYPTTLLAQTDSCIGSKSSINSGGFKNVVGTFTSPSKILIDTNFLNTLSDEDFRSGVGEMFKVHAIDSPEALWEISGSYDQLRVNHALLIKTIKRSLLIKRKLIEEDEFDYSIRNLLNYGHSFGHAIESATQYAVPHGIAVTIGMDVANYIAARLKYAPMEFYNKAHPLLKKNYKGYENLTVPMDEFFAALGKDKKNVDNQTLVLILPGADLRIEKKICIYDDNFKTICHNFFKQEFNQ